MELSEIETLLDAKLDPMKETIARLEKAQEQIVLILTSQARQDESIKHIRADVNACTKDRDELFTRLRALETDGGNKMWDTLKIILTAAGAFIAALIAGKVKI